MEDWIVLGEFQHTAIASSLCEKLADLPPKKRELNWLLGELQDTLVGLKNGLEDCYNLLGPDGAGNKLVVSTQYNETIKGTITRLGTQIVQGRLHLRLRTLPQQTLVIDPSAPITIMPLDRLHALLTHSIDLLSLTLSQIYPLAEAATFPNKNAATFLAAQLRVLAQALADASALLRGPAAPLADPDWTTLSATPAHFSPPKPPNISFYMGLQDSQLVLWLRALELADAPVNLGLKFALALGTARRLEHDEADKVFTYCCEDGSAAWKHAEEAQARPEGGPEEVYVREKVRVESADPTLLSLSAKLSALGHTLSIAQRNVAAVMGEEFEE